MRGVPFGYVKPPAVVPVVHALRENKRPIGFLPWPETPTEPDRVTFDAVDVSQYLPKPKKRKKGKA